jgi:hypothetical protein
MMNEPEHRVHLSQPAQALSPTRTVALVRLIQFQPIERYPRSGQPFVDLTLRYPDDGPEHPAEDLSLCFDTELARAVGQMLLTAGRHGLR